MPRYNVSIDRTESFLIEAETADDAVDAAFEASNFEPEQFLGKPWCGVLILEHGHETMNHTIEEAHPTQVPIP